MAGVCASFELMNAEEICDWLKNSSGKPFEEYILSAIKDNDLDGEALAAALGQGPESLKEAIPSLSKRLKLIGAIQVLRASLVSTESNQLTTVSAPQSSGSLSEPDLDYQSEVDTLILSPQQSGSSSSSTVCTPSRLRANTSTRIANFHAVDMTCNKKQSSLMEFVLPIFRPETQKNLQAERITERDRRYIVRTLSTMLLSVNPHPSLSDCCVPAQAVVKAYPFLADASDDGKQPHYSWAKFISQRCSNVNRHDGSNEVPKSERKKIENSMKHQYLEDTDSIIIDDAVAFNRNMKKLAAELLKTRPISENLEDLMMQTYPNRRASILSGELGLLDVLEKFPLLKKPKHIGLEFDRITGLNDSMQQFVHDWMQVWVGALFDISKSEGYNVNEANMNADSSSETDNASIDAFKLLIKLATPKKRKDAILQVLLSVKKGTPHDEIVGQSNQPMIVLMYDVVDSSENIYYIMIEQELILETRKFEEAIFLLLAVHYVFNLEYNTAVHDVLLFLQEFVCKLKSKVKHSAVYTAITTKLFRASQKILQSAKKAVPSQ